ncbi:MAG: hypothetical protein Q4Q28_08125 [Bacteroidales bacterium]|nr:hypothetical protein [Bacteroidales bacterium]
MMHTCNISCNVAANEGGSTVVPRAHTSIIAIAHQAHNTSIYIAQHRAATSATDVWQRRAHTAAPGAEAVQTRCIP